MGDMKKYDIYEIMNKKKIYSNFSDAIVTFVPKLTDEMKTAEEGVFCDGIHFVDRFAELFDDIDNLYCIMKDGHKYNLADFYTNFGAYKKGPSFPKNCINLIADREEKRELKNYNFVTN